MPADGTVRGPGAGRRHRDNLGTNGGDLGPPWGRRRKCGGKAQDFALVLLTPSRGRFRVAPVREAEALRGSGGGPRTGRTTGPPGRSQGCGWAVGDRRGGPGTGRGVPQGAVRCGAWRRVVRHDPAAGGAGPSCSWPRGARAASAVRLLGAASRPGTGAAARRTARPDARPSGGAGTPGPARPTPCGTGRRRRRGTARTRAPGCCGRCRRARRWPPSRARPPPGPPRGWGAR